MSENLQYLKKMHLDNGALLDKAKAALFVQKAAHIEKLAYSQHELNRRLIVEIEALRGVVNAT